MLGDDPWPYTVEGNRLALETMARYATICGVTDRTLEIEEMFAESTLVATRFGD